MPDARHPEDRPEGRFEGPWRRLLLAGLAAWLLLTALDWLFAGDATALGVSLRVGATLFAAPLVAATVLLDALRLAAAGTDIGIVKWPYGVLTVVFPPVALAYLLHVRWFRPDRPDGLNGPNEPDGPGSTDPADADR